MADVKKYYLFILGCQMNKSDAERVTAVLEKAGYQKTDKEQSADLIVAVACSVRQSAVDRIYGKVKLWNEIKKEQPLKTILTGCVLPSDKQKLANMFDLIFDISELPKLPKMLEDLQQLPKQMANRRAEIDSYYLNIVPKYQSDFSVFVPISTGCNNYCSYCVVPYVRGQEKSRLAKEIIDECQKLIERGYKEITLIGQNVNSYGLDQDPGKRGIYPRFHELLQTINDLPGNFWLRFITSHPKDMSDELVNVMAKNDKICNYIHLPVQSGDNEILKKMNRNYTREYYLSLIQKIRKIIPKVVISTDVIVGFPTETKQQFKNTVKLFKEAKFDMAYIAQYSPRLGTAAYILADDVPKKEKKRREKALNKVLTKTALKNNKKLIGKTMEVLVEEVKTNKLLRQAQDKVRPKTYNLIGKTRTYKTVKIITNQMADSCTSNRVVDSLAVNYFGQFVKVKITKARSFGLDGKLVK